MSKITLGYWKIRGLANPIRFILNYVNQDFEDVRYEQGEGPEFSKNEWLKVKHTLGLPFPNLPYLIDGKIKLTQSNAILRYLGKKYNLLGSNDAVYALSEEVLENAMDFRNVLVKLVYNPDYEKLADDYFKNIQPVLKGFDDFLESKDWFAGDSQPTICDFPMYELLAQHRLMRPESLKEFSNLQAFLDRFEALPKIRAYMQSEKFIKRPCNNKSAYWK